MWGQCQMSYKLAIFGGDARYIEVIHQLKTLENTELLLIGFDDLEFNATNIKQIAYQTIQPETLDAVILPIQGIGDEGIVEAPFSNNNIQLTTNWFKKLRKKVPIITGVMNGFLKTLRDELDLSVYSLMSRDDIAIYNSIPTAEGAIFLAMENTNYTIHSAQITVLGFGRIGQTVADRFKKLGANVSICTDNEAEQARATTQSLSAFSLRDLSRIAAYTDILINTVPAQLINSDLINTLKTQTLIIDLASAPGGTDFNYAKERGIQAILAQRLPSIVAPKTSGVMLSNVMKKLFESIEKGDRM